jgi:antitoxin component HigA of HigAB toxin-antitoxin module
MTESELPSAADLLRHLLDAKGVSQAQCFRDTGVSPTVICDILAGRRGFSKKSIRAFSKYFRVRANVFLEVKG